MLGRFNPFRKPDQNPIDQFTVDELRAARVKMERNRTKIMDEVKLLEEKKADEFQQGVQQADKRSKRIAAQRIKEAEEQIRQLDQQLAFCEKQLTIISRLEFLKRNRDQLVEMGIDDLLGKMDTGELRSYVDEVSMNGAVSADRLDDLAAMLGNALNAGLTDEEDPEIAELMAQMEMASLQSDELVLPDSFEMEQSDETENRNRFDGNEFDANEFEANELDDESMLAS